MPLTAFLSILSFKVNLCCHSLMSSVGSHKLSSAVEVGGSWWKLNLSRCIPAKFVVPPNQCMVSKLLPVGNGIAWYGHCCLSILELVCAHVCCVCTGVVCSRVEGINSPPMNVSSISPGIDFGQTGQDQENWREKEKGGCERRRWHKEVVTGRKGRKGEDVREKKGRKKQKRANVCKKNRIKRGMCWRSDYALCIYA